MDDSARGERRRPPDNHSESGEITARPRKLVAGDDRAYVPKREDRE
ncbi:hypothetical protein [Haloarcula laminariae]|nr:hypothetical protein [Halomicroarcula laminariae]